MLLCAWTLTIKCVKHGGLLRSNKCCSLYTANSSATQNALQQLPTHSNRYTGLHLSAFQHQQSKNISLKNRKSFQTIINQRCPAMVFHFEFGTVQKISNTTVFLRYSVSNSLLLNGFCIFLHFCLTSKYINPMLQTLHMNYICVNIFSWTFLSDVLPVMWLQHSHTGITQK